MRIFFVCQRVPFPPDRGDKIITHHQICHLANAHEVHVFCLADGKADLLNVPGVRNRVASVTAIPAGAVRGRIRALLALLRTTPLSVAMLNEQRLHAAIRECFNDVKPDIIIVCSSNAAQFAEPFDRIPRIMQFVDLDSMKWREYAVDSYLPMRWVYALEARRLLEYERNIAHRFSHSLVCTDMEARDFRDLIPDVPVSVLRNGVDLDYFRSTGSQKQPGSLVFTGVMNYAPNVDAVRWFCAEILPLIRSEVPGATLTICGSRPAAAVRRLRRIHGVTVTGWVPDVRPYLDRAEVSIAPIRLARGIQNKLLEAMAMGLPVVASRGVWHPTALPEGDGIFPADDPQGFAAQIIQLLREDTYRKEMGRRARGAVEKNYAWMDHFAALDRVIADAVLPGISASPGSPSTRNRSGS